MRKYIRNYVEGGTYFFTQITHNRFHYFSESSHADVCLSSLRHVQKHHPFELVAYCVLPDHLHLLITLPIDQKDFSTIMKEFKKKATKELRKMIGAPELKIWQDRFWEHTIRNERDMKTHFDYIHYNPIKHLYVDDPLDWEWSSYSEYYDRLIVNRPKINPKSFDMVKQGFGE
jgi:putative transposase